MTIDSCQIEDDLNARLAECYGIYCIASQYCMLCDPMALCLHIDGCALRLCGRGEFSQRDTHRRNTQRAGH